VKDRATREQPSDYRRGGGGASRNRDPPSPQNHTVEQRDRNFADHSGGRGGRSDISRDHGRDSGWSRGQDFTAGGDYNRDRRDRERPAHSSPPRNRSNADPPDRYRRRSPSPPRR